MSSTIININSAQYAKSMCSKLLLIINLEQIPDLALPVDISFQGTSLNDWGDADNVLAVVTDEAGLEVALLTSTTSMGASAGAVWFRS